MATGRSQPSIVMDVQVLVTHADSVVLMEREMGHPPRLIRGPDLCYLFQARDEERLLGLVDRWEASGIAAQVVQLSPMGEPSFRDRDPTPSSYQEQTGPDTSTLAAGLIRQTGPRLARPPTGGRMHPIMPRWGIRGMSDFTAEELAQVQQKLDGWIRQRAHDPERPRRRPWLVRKPHTVHPA